MTKILNFSSDTIDAPHLSNNFLGKGSTNGLNWNWKVSRVVGPAKTPDTDVLAYWTFEWDALKMQHGVKGFKGHVILEYWTGDKFVPKRFGVDLDVSGQTVERKIGILKDFDFVFTVYHKCKFRFEALLVPIYTNINADSLVKNFEKTPATDAILSVNGREMHVNKGFLSFQSSYFLSTFADKEEEVEIDDVDYEDFARLLSAIYPNPYLPTAQTSVALLKLADRFKIPEVVRLVEPLIISHSGLEISEKLSLADEFKLADLMDYCMQSIKTVEDIKKVAASTEFNGFSKEIKAQLLALLVAV